MKRSLLAAAVAVGVGALAACTGGAGSAFGEIATQDPPPASQDAVSKTGESSSPTNESVAKTGEPASPGADTPTGGGGSFSCNGTYDCVGTDGDKGSTIVLNGSPGNCSTGQTSINADGTISVAGQVYAHWTGGDGAFTFTTTDTNTDSFPDGGTNTTTTTDVVTCVKVSTSTVPIDAGH